jgi:hypothetical protein
MYLDKTGFRDGEGGTAFCGGALHAYVANDPVNLTDPSGTQAYCKGSNCDGDTVVVTGGGGSRSGGLGWGLAGRFMLDAPLEGPGGGDLFRDLLAPVLERAHDQVRRTACRALGNLGENGRVRLGADGGAGAGFAGVGGLGFSIHQDGSINADRYFGYGLGLGATAGGGLSIDNRAAPTGPSHTRGISGSAGPFSADYSRAGGWTWGISPGLGRGWMVSGTDTFTQTTQLTSPIC